MAWAWSASPEATSSRVMLDHLHAPKVSQVDADNLDEGLAHMLGERVERSLSNFKSSLSIDFKPELELILKLVMFRFSYFSSAISASPGASLQNLRLVSKTNYHPSRRRLLLYLLLHPPIFPTYILTRLRNRALSNQWPDLPASDLRRKMWDMLNRLETFARAWELLGWGMFLWDGRYPSLLMRMLGLRLVPSSPHLAKMVSYEFMNRQLVWGAFTEFLMFAVPRMPRLPFAFTPAALIKPLQSFFSQPTSINYDTIPLLTSSASTAQPSRAAHTGPLADLPLSTCPICHLRTSSSPVPLASNSTGSSLSLPPIHGAGIITEFGHEASTEETRVFIPAQTDCWGGCKWCYYCITGELIQFRQEHQKKLMPTAKKGIATDRRAEGDQEEAKWDCLRCGGGVTRAWRVGMQPEKEEEDA